MREVRSTCPRCGRVSFLPVDSWSDFPSMPVDAPCPGGCVPIRRVQLRATRPEPGVLGPLCLGVALVVAPLVAVLEIVLR